MTKKLAWSPTEDRRLTKLIEARRICTKKSEVCSINASWGEIAELMPNRSAKQCRERWCYNLNPAIKKDIWTVEEDARLVKAQRLLGNQWALIARYLPGRTENSVKTRHKSIMRAKKRAWTEDEDEVILSMHRQIGSRWEKIAERLPSRTSNGVKTRFALLRKGHARETPIEGAPEQILFHPNLVEGIDLDIPISRIEGRTKRRRNFFNIPASELMEQTLDPVEFEVGALLADTINEVAILAGEESARLLTNVKRKRKEVTLNSYKKVQAKNSMIIQSNNDTSSCCRARDENQVIQAQINCEPVSAQLFMSHNLQHDGINGQYPLFCSQRLNGITLNQQMSTHPFGILPSVYPQSVQAMPPLHQIILLNQLRYGF